MITDADVKYMRMAVSLAETFPDSYRGKAVGAILISAHGLLLGMGTRQTEKNTVGSSGKLYEDKTIHAEFAAIQNAERTHPCMIFSDSTLYTTMEPCLERMKNPAWYPFPPCADKIISSKIGRVVIGASDAWGGGHEKLLEAGIKVEFLPQESTLAKHCRALTENPIIPPGQEENLKQAEAQYGFATKAVENLATALKVVFDSKEEQKPQTVWPRPRLCVDFVVLDASGDWVLLVQRGEEPFKGQWCVPGGMVKEHEQIASAVMRKLQEETGITAARIDQVCVLSDICDDPRGWTVSVVHRIIPHTARERMRPGKNEADLKWFKTDELPQDLVLGFGDVINTVAAAYREKM